MDAFLLGFLAVTVILLVFTDSLNGRRPDSDNVYDVYMMKQLSKRYHHPEYTSMTEYMNERMKKDKLP